VTGDDPALEEGWVDRELALEFPELRLVSVVAPAPGRGTPSALRERLALLADRFHGARALTLRREPVPAAYRVFFRHVGLDPDAQRTPVEQRALERLMHGGFRSAGIVEDALTIAIMETGVPVWALDAARLSGDLEVREDAPGGRLVVADDHGTVALLFGEPVPEHAATKETTRVALFSIQVANVPSIHVGEALWMAAEILEA
jgi:DNA/RNA-binding domain of Phe-tRNA-synthetase-like protein